jgi:AcrR family transcriptional regulator
MKRDSLLSVAPWQSGWSMDRTPSRAIAHRAYGGASAAERRSQRRAALLDAALDVLAAGGVAAVSVRGVCAAARLNDRYFYESFPDTDELLGALIEDQVGLAFRTLSDATATTGDLPSRVHSVITAALDFFAEDPRRGRLLIESQATEQLRSGRKQFVRVVAALMITEAHKEKLPSVPDPELEVIALTLINGGLEIVSQWLSGELGATRDQLLNVLVAMILTSTKIQVDPSVTRPHRTRRAPGTRSHD